MKYYHKMQSLITAYVCSQKALRYAARKEIPGLKFAHYGQNLGMRLLTRWLPGAQGYLLAPVSITRYFEFAFAYQCLPNYTEKYLDISSPRLFSYYVAENNLAKQVTIYNPDVRDVRLTNTIAKGLDMRNIYVICKDVRAVSETNQRYDCILSISVIEHISGNYEDTQAIQWMFNALTKNGRLILTFPVDRQFWIEYRKGRDPYGTQTRTSDKEYFFQRFYDLNSIQKRLLDPLGVAPRAMRWFGEKSPGRFHDYIQRWQREGLRCVVEDPREIADHYQEFDTWESMPGVGVCGLVIEKS